MLPILNTYSAKYLDVLSEMAKPKGRTNSSSAAPAPDTQIHLKWMQMLCQNSLINIQMQLQNKFSYLSDKQYCLSRNEEELLSRLYCNDYAILF